MFQHLRKIQSESLAPTDTITDSKGELTKDAIFDYLNDDDDKKDDELDIDLNKDKDKDKKDDKKTEKKEAKTDEESDEDDKTDTEETEEPDELEELEEELEEPDEDKLELTIPASRREILKKYPKIFKDFPGLETAFYREQAYTKLIPTIAEAKEAVDKSQTLDKFEADLEKGNTEVVLNAIKQNNPKAFAKVADEYMSTLAKVDEKAYHHVLGNTIRHTIIAMVEESRNSGNEALEQAAVILNQFIFGSSKFTSPQKLVNDNTKTSESDEKEQKITERERNLARQRFNSANDDLSTRVDKAYRGAIEAAIDPKDSMSEYVKKTAIRDAQEELESLIEKDTRFKTLVDKLWEKAIEDDYSSDSVNRIKRAFASKAQTLLPNVVQKARIAALKGMGKRVRDDNNDNKDEDSHPSKESKKSNDSRSRRESNRGEESRQRNDSGSKSKIPVGMSSLEYLMSDD